MAQSTTFKQGNAMLHNAHHNAQDRLHGWSRRWGGYLCIGLILVAGAFALGGTLHRAAGQEQAYNESSLLGVDFAPRPMTAAEKADAAKVRMIVGDEALALTEAAHK